MNQWFRNISIRSKIFIILGLVGVLGLFANVWGIINLRSVDDEMNAVFLEFQHEAALQNARSAILLAEIIEKDYLETSDPDYLTQHAQFIEEARAEIAQARETSTNEKQLDTIQSLETGLIAYEDAFENVAGLMRTNQRDEAARYSLEVSELRMNQLQAIIQEDLDAGVSAVQTLVANAHDNVRAAQQIGLLLMLIFLLAGGGFGITLASIISRPLKDIARSFEDVLAQDLSDMAAQLKRLADGDLTAEFHTNARALPVRGRDEVGVLVQSFNVIVERLHEVERSFAQKVRNLSALSEQIQKGAQDVGVASSQILSTVSEHSAGTAEQSAAVSEVTATVDQVRATAEQTAERAREVSQRADESARVSREGRESAQHIMESMEDIYEKVDGIAKDILELSEQTQQIGVITATVNDIADQSNLLALNATIEAAKAGEHGKGFAVVAGEVRKLAEQAKQATTEVQGILSEIQKKTNAAVMATEQGAKVVQEGIELTRRAGQVINELSVTIEQSSRSAHQIAVSAQHQSQGMDQIAQAITDINRATVQFTSSAQHSQTSAQDLDSLARQLLNVSAGYKIR